MYAYRKVIGDLLNRCETGAGLLIKMWVKSTKNIRVFLNIEKIIPSFIKIFEKNPSF